MDFPRWRRKRRNANLDEEIRAHLTLAEREVRESGARVSTRGGIMNQSCVGFVLGALASTVIAGGALSAAPKGIEIQTEDVTRFYKVYEAAGGHPSVKQLQHDYLDPGTTGLHHLAKARNVTAERIAQAIETNPELYADARTCMAALPRVRERLNDAFRKLLILYPEAQKPPRRRRHRPRSSRR
jgi:hypothetical protein